MSQIADNARILIVEDEPTSAQWLEVVLRAAGYINIYATYDSREVQQLCTEITPDLLLLDLMMPHISGFEVMRALAAGPRGISFPILVLTSDQSKETRQRALTEGAKDFLSKPLDRIEVLLRVRNLLETRMQHLLLEERVNDRTHALRGAQLETLQRLALAAEYRDDDTGMHTRRVGAISALLAQQIGKVEKHVDLIRQTAPLHDVGKISVPDKILLKPGRLTSEEFDIMKTHIHVGAKILSGSSSLWLQMAEEIALTHHERWDGTGYLGLAGEAIAQSGRIVAIADVFDALTHERPYKAAWAVADAVNEIRSQSGRQFDPVIVEAFLKLDHKSLI